MSDSKRYIIIDPSDPMGVANQLISSLYLDDQGSMLSYFYQAQWWSYIREEHKWKSVTKETVRREYMGWLSNCYLSDNVRYRPRIRFMSELREIMEAICELAVEELPPFWIPEEHDPPCDATAVVAFKNGLLNLNSWSEDGPGELIPHSPRWFSNFVLPFEYENTYECDTFMSFLGDCLGGDDDSIRCMMEWIGYCMSPSTEYQKFAVFAGRPGSGKSTLCRVIEALIGKHNIANPRLSSLCGAFGLEPLRDKTVAIIGDAHLERGNALQALEIIKSVTGEDSVSVNRKFIRASPSEKLKIRFIISCNEIPNFPDSTGALERRLLPFSFENAIMEDDQDRDIFDKIMHDAPGIINRCLRAYHNLCDHGAFTAAIRNDTIRYAVRGGGSDMRQYLEECFVRQDYVGPGSLRIGEDDFCRGFNLYRMDRGQAKMSHETIRNRLQAVEPAIWRTRRRSTICSKWTWLLRGLTWNPWFLDKYADKFEYMGIDFLPATNGILAKRQTWMKKRVSLLHDSSDYYGFSDADPDENPLRLPDRVMGHPASGPYDLYHFSSDQLPQLPGNEENGAASRRADDSGKEGESKGGDCPF